MFRGLLPLALVLSSCLDTVDENLWRGRDGLPDVEDASVLDLRVDGAADGPGPLSDALHDTLTPDGPTLDTLTPDLLAADGPPPPDVSGTPGASTSPLVAASTGGYGVVWLDAPAGAPALLFRMLDGAGVAVAGPTTIAAGPVQAVTAMIWNGLDFVVLYTDAAGLQRVRVTEAGAPVTTKSLAGAGVTWAQVVQAGNGYGLAYATASQVLLQRLDGQGNKLGSPEVVYTAPSTGFTSIGGYRSPMLAHGDGYFGVAFAVQSGSSPTAQGPLYFARVTTAGALVGSPQQIQAGAVLYPSVGHGAGQFTVTWHASGGPAMLRVNATTGAVSGGATVLGGDSCCEHGPMAAAGTAGLVEVWTTQASGVGIVGVDPANGAKLLGPQVALTRPGLAHPWIAPRSGVFGLVWADTSPGGSEVFFSRLSATGTPVGAPLRVSP